MPLFPVSQVSS